jgi:ankyrin repeat protein
MTPNSLFLWASFNVFKIILEANPKAIEVQTTHRSLPLNLALGKDAASLILVLPLYPSEVKGKRECAWIVLDPQAVQVQNNDRNLPIHYACKHVAFPDILMLILSQYPNTCNFNNSPEVINILIGIFPDAVFVKDQDGDGDLPFHCACQCNVSHQKSSSWCMMHTLSL